MAVGMMAAMLGASAAQGIIGGIAGAKGAKAQAKSAEKAALINERMYQQAREDIEPWRKVGREKLGKLSGLEDEGYFDRPFDASALEADPGYLFRLKEGQKALERGASARGGLLGGRAGKELTRYGQEYASDEFSKAYGRQRGEEAARFGRLSSMAGYGPQASSITTPAGSAAAGRMGEAGMQAGAARASGYDAISRAMMQPIQAYSFSQMMK